MSDLLKYPLEPLVILQKLGSLKREILQNKQALLSKKVAVLGGENTGNFTALLELFLLEQGIRPIFYESAYNRFYEDAVFGGVGVDGTALDDFEPDIVYIHTTHRNIQYFPRLSDSKSEVQEKRQRNLARFKEIWTELERFSCPIIQNNFDLPGTRTMGNLECYDYRGKVNFINSLNILFAEEACKSSNLLISDINYLSAQIGHDNWVDEKLWYSARQSISIMAFPRLCQNLTSIMLSVLGETKKCLVLDLDGTCWGGVIADDGIDKISLGENGAEGEVFSDFQQYLTELNQRGVILAVCSKNEKGNALLGFEHPGSVLHPENFASFKANWEMKDQNLADIAAEININTNACVFMDDSQYERQLVMANLPNVEVPDVSSGAMDYTKHLDQNGFFEPVGLNNDDLHRQQYYQQNQLRAAQKKTYQSLEEYLQSLDMKGSFKEFESLHFDRILQLVNKTNQFNLTMQRATSAEIETFCQDKKIITLYGRLSDKYGDNGIVSVMVGRVKEGVCTIHIWVLSCRVFQRGFEQAMFDRFIEQCRQRDINKVIANYIPGDKNKIVQELYSELGATLIEKTEKMATWELRVSEYQTQSKWIN